jgi:hypothetical protein
LVKQVKGRGGVEGHQKTPNGLYIYWHQRKIFGKLKSGVKNYSLTRIMTKIMAQSDRMVY